MVVTVTYRPSDLEVVKKKEALKRKLGVPSDPSKWTDRDRRKVADYFRSIGWPMAMAGCNPESFIWKEDPVTNKALCMLYNELVMSRDVASIESAQRDLKSNIPVVRESAKTAIAKAKRDLEHLRRWNTVIKRVDDNVKPEKPRPPWKVHPVRCKEIILPNGRKIHPCILSIPRPVIPRNPESAPQTALNVVSPGKAKRGRPQILPMPSSVPIPAPAPPRRVTTLDRGQSWVQDSKLWLLGLAVLAFLLIRR